jgi:hypothetical protein
MAIFQQSVTSVERTSNHSFLFQLMILFIHVSGRHANTLDLNRLR